MKGHGFELHGMLLIWKSYDLFQTVAAPSLFAVYLAWSLDSN